MSLRVQEKGMPPVRHLGTVLWYIISFWSKLFGIKVEEQTLMYNFSLDNILISLIDLEISA